MGRRARAGDEPGFGWGLGRRALRTRRDRDAENVRDVLRRAGCPDWREDREAAGGFVVTAGRDGLSFFVDCEHDDPHRLADELNRYARALRAAGYRVEPDLRDDATLLVRPGLGAVEPSAARQRQVERGEIPAASAPAAEGDRVPAGVETADR